MNNKQAARVRERKLRRQYRRKLRIGIAIALIIGLAGGFFAGYFATGILKRDPDVQVKSTSTPRVPSLEATPEATQATSEVAEATPEVTEAPEATAVAEMVLVTTAPTEEPEPTTTASPTETVVPFGETATITAQVYTDGTVRKENDARAYETVQFTMQVTRYLSETYYEQNWSDDYDLRGDESSVEFEIMLKDYMGTLSIAPQDILDFSYELLNGETEGGYQLTTAELQGLDKAVLETNIPKTLYKRFDYNPSEGDMKYLVVKAYVNGIENTYYFEVGDPIRPTPEPTPEPTPVPEYTTLEKGSSGDAVRLLQDALIRLGYLTDSADGNYGEHTVRAVKKAQKAFEMEQTGIADDEFQTRLFEEVKNK